MPLKQSKPVRKLGRLYRHKEKGTEYLILNTNLKVKDRVSREWMDAVLYVERSDVYAQNMYVRELNDFLDQFEEIISENKV